MKKLFFIFLLLLTPIILFASIDERKTDVYWANGILTKKEDAEYNTLKVLQPAIIEKYGTDYYNQHIGKVAYAYNQTSENILIDGKETFWQKFEIGGISWQEIEDFLFDTSHGRDLDIQIKAYKESIKAGHTVLAVAHSQGNLFTYEAYNSLDGWMQKYFEAVSVASPMSADIKYGTTRIDWDNDLVPRIATSGAKLPKMISNSVRKVNWNTNSPTIELNSNYLTSSQIGQTTQTPNGFRYTAEEAGIDTNSFVHAFTFYMGETLKDSEGKTEIRNAFTGSTLRDTQAKVIIMTAIDTKLTLLQSLPSQWSTSNSDAGTCRPSQKKCDDKKKSVTHISGLPEMNTLMSQTKVIPFDGGGKLYTARGNYVKSSSGAEDLQIQPTDEICYELDGQILKLEHSGDEQGLEQWVPVDIQTQGGAIEATLSWSNYVDIDMDLTMSGPHVIQDVKDVEKSNIEHAYVASQYDIYPGDTFDISAHGSVRAGSNLNVACLDQSPINLYAVVNTPSGSKFKHYQVKSFSALNLGTFATIEVDEKEKIEIEVVENNNSSSNNYNGFSRNTRLFENYDGSGQSCGSVPCEYIVRGMENAIEWGPIGGAEVSIVKAESFTNKSAEIIYRGTSSINDDMFKAGLIEFSSADIAKFDDDTYYVISAEGGYDLDRDDDLIRDPIPTKNGGTVHAIIKGSDIKTVAFRVNVLTEASFQVCGDLLGEHYDKNALDERLSKIAQKLIKEKTFVLNDELGVNYHDVLLWAPAVDQERLFKDYDTFIEPIIIKTYANEDRFDESYSLIYDPLDPKAPQLTPMSITIPRNLPSKSTIGKVNILNETNSTIVSMQIEGKNSEAFSIDKRGYIYLEDNTLLADQAIYYLKMSATNDQNLTGTAVGLTIQVNGELTLADANASIPYLDHIDVVSIYENPSIGTMIAKVTFKDDLNEIVNYKISGQYSNGVEIDSDGYIKVVDPTVFDYENSSVYTLSVSAVNEVGNESLKVPFSINVNNTIDTPLYELVFLQHISENVPIGTVVGQIQRLREGLGEVEQFDILNTNTPFSIDKNGVVTTSAPIDYETQANYQLTAIARTIYGDSNKIDVQIYIDDQNPESSIPTLKNQEFLVAEDVQTPYVIGNLDLDDAGYDMQQITLSGSGAYNFHVDNDGTLSLVANANIDYETKTVYELKVKALNEVGYSNEATLTIRVENKADTLAILGNTVLTVDENSIGGTVVGNINVVSEGEMPIESYSLSDNSLFVIDSNGTVSVAQGANLDYEAQSQINLTVTAITAVGESVAKLLRINLNDADDAPQLQPFSGNIDENATIGTVVGQLSFESGFGDVISMRLESLDSQPIAFSIDKDGVISVANNLDYETKTNYSFSAYAKNDYGESNATSVNIAVNNILDSPELENLSVHVSDIIKGGGIVGTLTYREGPDLITSMVLSGDESQKFEISNDGIIRLKANEALNYEEKSLYTFSAQAFSTHYSSNIAEINVIVDNIDEYATAGTGRWGGATVNIYKIENDSNLTLLYSEKTSIGDDVDTTGTFYSHNLALEDDSYYIYEVYGGKDYDTDNDGVLDATPTINKGILHAIVKGNWIKEVTWRPHINLMTEVYYQAAIDYINDLEELEERLLHTEFYTSNYPYNNAKGALMYNPLSNLKEAWNDEKFPQYSVKYLEKEFCKNYSKSVQFIKNSLISPSYPVEHSVSLSYDHKYLVYSGYGKVDITDLTDLNNITKTMVLDGPMNLLAMSHDNRYLFATSRDYSDSILYLDVFDLGDINNINLIPLSSTFVPKMTKMQLSSDGTKLYFTFSDDETNGFGVIGLEDLQDPILMTTLTTPGQAIDFKLSQDEKTAYIADDRAGLKIIDISDPTKFVLQGEYLTDGLVNNITLSEDETKIYAGISLAESYKGSIEVIDITDKQSPSKTIGFDLNGSTPTKIVLNDDESKLFINQEYPEYAITIFENVDNFQEVNAFSETNNYKLLDIVLLEDETIMYSISEYYLDVVDISDPINPIILSEVELKELPR